MEAKHDAFRNALRWFLDHGEAEKGLRMATALYLLWLLRGYIQEAREWFAPLLAQPTASPPTRGKAAP